MINIWKKWRKEDESKRTDKEEEHRTDQEIWLETLKETEKIIKREVEEVEQNCKIDL